MERQRTQDHCSLFVHYHSARSIRRERRFSGNHDPKLLLPVPSMQTQGMIGNTKSLFPERALPFCPIHSQGTIGSIIFTEITIQSVHCQFPRCKRMERQRTPNHCSLSVHYRFARSKRRERRFSGNHDPMRALTNPSFHSQGTAVHGRILFPERTLPKPAFQSHGMAGLGISGNHQSQPKEPILYIPIYHHSPKMPAFSADTAKSHQATASLRRIVGSGRIQIEMADTGLVLTPRAMIQIPGGLLWIALTVDRLQIIPFKRMERFGSDAL